MARPAGILSDAVNAIYLYGILRCPRKSSAARAPAGLPGATSPEVLRLSGSTWLVVAEVPLETYGPGPLEKHLADLDWVGRVALAHEEVVEHFARNPDVTLIPMKLFTMFSSRERAIEDVAGRQATIARMMRRISGAQEWGIRVTRSDDAPAARPAARPVVSSGAAFLAARKQTRDSAKQAKLMAAESALQAYERLANLARESRIRRDAPASAATPPLLDAAFLVPAAQRTKFTRAAEREAAECAKAGAQMTLTGPWPAYNFVHDGEGSQ